MLLRRKTAGGYWLMKIILTILALAIALLLFLASRKPKSLSFSRSISIQAPKSKVYAHIGSLRAYDEWNPWSGADPTQNTSFEGEDGAIGSKMSWKGKKTGEGHMSLGEANGTDAVRYDLEFLKPMKGSAQAAVTLKEANGATDVTWAYSGESSFVARIFAVFMDFEKMIGGQYEKGLADLKQLSER